MKQLRIGLAGLGTVGEAVFRFLRANQDIIAHKTDCQLVLEAVSARDKSKHEDLGLDGVRWFDDAKEMAADSSIDVVVELIGGSSGKAHDVCETALENGKHLVTANKALLAEAGLSLAQKAEEKNAALLYEAAVLGGIPAIKVVRESLSGNRIGFIQGIMNGTCNYILSNMAKEGMPFEAALKQAQKLGYAEADPTADIEGFDSAHKLALLSTLAFGVRPDLSKIKRCGIAGVTPLDFIFARELSCVIKLLGVAEQKTQGLDLRVEPCFVPQYSPLAAVDGVLNACLVQSEADDPVTLVGAGAGGIATASAILADLTDLARGQVPLPFGCCQEKLEKVQVLAPENRTGHWAVRAFVQDKTGVLAELSAILRDHDISVKTLLQHGRAKKNGYVPLFVVTHEASEAQLQAAFDAMAALQTVFERPVSYRIEGF